MTGHDASLQDGAEVVTRLIDRRERLREPSFEIAHA
jgi:hypothetical protein